MEIITTIAAIFGFCLIVSGIFLVIKSNQGEKIHPWSNKSGISILDTQEEKNKMESWNTDEINTQLVRLKDTGNPLNYYIESIVERFITGQDTKTEKTRAEWLKIRLEQLNVANAYADAMHEAGLKQKKFQKDSLTIDLDIRGLELKDELRGFDKEESVLTKKISIAEKQNRLKEIENPPIPKPESSEKEKIKAEINDWEDETDRLEGRKRREMNTAYDDDHRQHIENKYNHQIQEIKNKIDELKRKLRNL